MLPYSPKYEAWRALKPFACAYDPVAAELCPIDMNRHCASEKTIYWDNSTRLGRSGEPYCFLQMTLAGAGYFRDVHGEQNIGVGRLFLVPVPSETAYGCRATDHWDWIWFAFRGELGFRLVHAINQAHGHVLELPADSSALRTLADWYDRSVEDRMPDNITFSTQLYQLLLELLRGDAAEESHQQLLIRRANTVIDIEFADTSLTVEAIARRIGLSKFYFIRLYRAQTGRTPGEALRLRRLSVARNLIVTTSLLMKEITDRVGYSNPVTFSAAFRNEFGCPPSRLRKRG